MRPVTPPHHPSRCARDSLGLQGVALVPLGLGRWPLGDVTGVWVSSNAGCHAMRCACFFRGQDPGHCLALRLSNDSELVLLGYPYNMNAYCTYNPEANSLAYLVTLVAV